MPLPVSPFYKEKVRRTDRSDGYSDIIPLEDALQRLADYFEIGIGTAHESLNAGPMTTVGFHYEIVKEEE